VTSESEHIDDQVSILSYEPERVTVEAHIDSPGYLVLTDAFYPGWRAQVDGQSVEILRADYYFRAIYLPQGDHAIEFAYDPTSFRIGLAVSLVSVLAVAGALGWERLRKQLSAC
jgi:uncharacterized membrane protein YfhO